jgi:hypothetical protein
MGAIDRKRSWPAVSQICIRTCAKDRQSVSCEILLLARLDLKVILTETPWTSSFFVMRLVLMVTELFFMSNFLEQ